jgi:hypothetical protein
MMKWMVIFSLGVFVVACKPKETCQETEVVSISSFIAPDSAIADTANLYLVQYGVKNACGHFGAISEQVDSHDVFVSITADYSGCNCELIAPLRQTQYFFYPADTGIYYMHFQSADGVFLIDTLRVH